MPRKILLPILILVPAFFLVMLGMRNPVLDHTPGPKQRPRAVIEKELKGSFACAPVVHAADLPAPLVVPARQAEPYRHPIPMYTGVAAPARCILPPRAPPISLAAFS
ncbi:hypothetical protein [Geomesophilobacter sediminis]|uniref:Uncharacterized protein n=1 Tax=Geomesophilobacter sediminis TaxID=2798584 RepID=A0A8J7IPH2_9BACT|nr:hypothetical protein [Geomesophilobacter sediminis]MBJ6725463.1 hypothetical protein [Geomesophilobacter sediminis]